MMNDLKMAFRTLLKRPGYFAACVCTLAIGVGAVSAIFSVVNGTLLKPLPYPDSERIVRLTRVQGQWSGPVSAPLLDDWRSGTYGEIVALGAFTETTMNLTGDGDARRLDAYRVTPDFWEVMAMPAAVGRTFDHGDDRASERVAVLGHDFWRVHFASDPSVVGRDLTLNGQQFRVLGVLPDSFKYLGADVYVPTYLHEAVQERGNNGLFAIARLKPGVSLDTFTAAIETVNARLAVEYPDSHSGLSARIDVLPERLNGYLREPLLVMLGAAALVLLIACANLANLLLARGTTQMRELAVRSALGASRARLVRASLFEAIVIAVSGGILGIGLAALAVPALLTLAPNVLPSHAVPGIDLTVVAVSLTVALATVLVFASWPAVKAARGAEAAAMNDAGRSGSLTGTGTRATLVVAEVALCVSLLVGAGLLIESMRTLSRVDGGVMTEGVLTAAFTIDGVQPIAGEDMFAGYWRHVAAASRQLDRILARVEAIPGVRSVGLTDALPLSGINNVSSNVGIVGREVADGQPRPGATWRFVNPDFSRTMGTAIVAGRHLTDDDYRYQVAPTTVMVNESFVRRYLADVDPIGQRLTFFDGSEKTIVGVVKDSRGLGLDREPLTEVFMHHGYSVQRQLYLALRVDGDPYAYADTIRRAIAEVEPAVPVFDIQSMDDLVGGTMQMRAFNMTLMMVFSGVALLLAALGLYGVIAYGVAERRREIGIRLSLGARPARVALLVLGAGLRMVVVGAAVGLAAGYALSRLLAAQLYGVTPGDPVVITATVGVLLAVSVVATLIPARAASRIPPMEALRHE